MNAKPQNDDFQVEIEDDLDTTPEEPQRAARAPAEGADEEDLSQYSDKVQKRISKLVYDRNEERRQREEAARQREEASQLREEAIRYAETVARENAELKKRLNEGQTSALAESKGRIEAELANQRAAFKQAYEAGDSDAVADAQIKIAELTSRKAQLETTAAQQAARAAAPAPAPQMQRPAAPAAPRVAPPDPMAQDWASKNADWFGKDELMTGYAFGMHERLVKSGVDPRSRTYYDKIDEAIREKFPEKFDTPGEDVVVPPRTTGNVVAPASRDVKSPRTVRLTASAAQLAKRLGLTPEQYAAQVLKDRNNG
jgi:hypothetical protein